MSDTDKLHRFLFDNLDVRGHIVNLDATWRDLQTSCEYPAAITQLLGQAAAATLLMASTIKFDGQLTLQATGGDDVPLLVMQCSHDYQLRGMARWDEGFNPDIEDPIDLLVGAQLVITIQKESGERYQGIVAVQGETFAEALAGYFQQSEQLPTRFYLNANGNRASGMMLQRLGSDADSEDDWNRLGLLADTLSAEEQLTLPVTELLHRLFNEDDIQLFTPHTTRFKCNCSPERIAGVIRGLGEAQLTEHLAEHGKIEIDCEFCGRNYGYDPVDAMALMKAAQPPSAMETKH